MVKESVRGSAHWYTCVDTHGQGEEQVAGEEGLHVCRWSKPKTVEEQDDRSLELCDRAAKCQDTQRGKVEQWNMFDRGLQLQELVFLGRWRSAVVLTYANDALQEVPTNKIHG